jgi:glycosyltransferase involved in cell wall biosynthesis
VDLSRLEVVIPALNGGERLVRVIEDCFALDQGLRGRLIVVDDGSEDGTAALARDAGARVVRHPRNFGKGAALRTGFERALTRRIDAVVTLDADGQHLPSEIPKLVERWRESGADLVIGSRAHLFDQMLSRRRLANRFSAWSMTIVGGVKVHDSQSGFRLYTTRFLREVEFESNRFDAESEMIVIGARKGFRIAETPIELGFVEGTVTSHYRPLLDTLRIARTVVVARARPIVRTAGPSG